MASLKVPEDIWELIVAHYSGLDSPSTDDKKVMSFIIAKEARRLDREDFLESRARYARLKHWEKPEQ